MLSERAAVEIYKMKIALQRRHAPESMWGKTRSVARIFGVNTRTVKYIWNRQTWRNATEYLWVSELETQESGDSQLKEKVSNFDWSHRC